MPETETNKLDKLFGPSGSFAGIIILAAGSVALIFSFSALFLVVIGAFAAFTTTCTTIDYSWRSVRYSTALFGFIHTGKWIAVDGTKAIAVRQSGRSYRAYSRSNRPLDMSERDFSIVLKDDKGREICPLQRFATRAEAEAKAPKIASRLAVKYLTNSNE